ncbi:hypothetical protein IF2G_11136 [Cordyceps javanica]|nr:hypothetical protein IF2G_11136 [Cordyceps javanica]
MSHVCADCKGLRGIKGNNIGGGGAWRRRRRMAAAERPPSLALLLPAPSSSYEQTREAAKQGNRGQKRGRGERERERERKTTTNPAKWKLKPRCSCKAATSRSPGSSLPDQTRELLVYRPCLAPSNGHQQTWTNAAVAAAAPSCSKRRPCTEYQ